MNAITSFEWDYRFLSNFHPCVIHVWDDQGRALTFLSTENAYQACKTLDISERRSLMYLTPGKAKRMGKNVTLRSDWNDDLKLFIMEQLLWQKFSSVPLMNRLLLTGDSELIEGNTWNDRFWGICDDVGQNHLGKILMKIRAKLKEIHA